VQSFFIQHLPRNKRASPQTIASYRDTLKLLLQYVQDQTGREPALLQGTDLNVPLILTFLDYLEQQRYNSIRSRNARLAALRTFFRWIALQAPEHVGLATRVLAIPLKRADKKLVQALSRLEIDSLLAAPDLRTWQGRRNHALVLLLYNSGARVSEIIALQRGQVSFGASTFLQLHGKGRKERTVPLWTQTARTLLAWFRDLEGAPHPFAFPSTRGRPLSRDGVAYLLQQIVTKASPSCPSLAAKKISPHTLRQAST
jgi:site-specific recombinase XerD